jgi:hypothetical protein
MILHCGARPATIDDVVAVPTPAATDTWFPIPHITVLETACEQIAKAGFAIRESRLALNREGGRFFATLDLFSTVTDGVALAVGLRNSIDKSLPMGFAAGHRVFVCDNLAFHSELLVTRKHTRNGQERFREAISLAAGRIGEFQAQERHRIEAMRTLAIEDQTAESLILRAWEAKIISHRQLPDVIREWRQPAHEEFEPRTRWSLFNAFTEVLKPFSASNPQGFAARTFNLNSLLAPPTEGPTSLAAVLAEVQQGVNVMDVDAIVS